MLFVMGFLFEIVLLFIMKVLMINNICRKYCVLKLTIELDLRMKVDIINLWKIKFNINF